MFLLIALCKNDTAITHFILSNMLKLPIKQHRDEKEKTTFETITIQLPGVFKLKDN